MCPFCFATVGLVVAGPVSTGGPAARAVKVSRKKNQKAETTSNEKERSNENVNPHRQ
jgi:Na+/glutamate symporter